MQPNGSNLLIFWRDRNVPPIGLIVLIRLSAKVQVLLADLLITSVPEDEISKSVKYL
jgi:hypothetical protein